MHQKKSNQLCWHVQWAAWTKTPVPQRKSPEIYFRLLPIGIHWLVFCSSEVTAHCCPFYRAVGPSVLAFDELRTLVWNISAIVSFRPSVSIWEIPADLYVLAPAHIGNAWLRFNRYSEPDGRKNTWHCCNSASSGAHQNLDWSSFTWSRMKTWLPGSGLWQEWSSPWSMETTLLELPYWRQHQKLRETSSEHAVSADP